MTALVKSSVWPILHRTLRDVAHLCTNNYDDVRSIMTTSAYVLPDREADKEAEKYSPLEKNVAPSYCLFRNVALTCLVGHSMLSGTITRDARSLDLEILQFY